MTIRCLIGLSLCMLATGCGGGGEDKWTKARKQVIPVTGRVLLDGVPVEAATVNFHSETEDLAAYGRTDADGRFRLTTYETNDGAVPGKHVVTIKKVITNTVLNPDDPEAEPLSSTEEWVIPERYSKKETSEQSAEVTEEGENDFTFELE